MRELKPKVEYYWVDIDDHYVNWRLVGSNGEVMCQSNQGYRDKADARRAVRAVMTVLGVPPLDAVNMHVREVGPGKKP